MPNPSHYRKERGMVWQGTIGDNRREKIRPAGERLDRAFALRQITETVLDQIVHDLPEARFDVVA